MKLLDRCFCVYLHTLFHGFVEQHYVELEGINILIFLHVRRMVYVGFMCTVSNSKKKSRPYKTRSSPRLVRNDADVP